ncbi:MAG TPA: hypothetical protein VFV19_11770 [Candidatus Polarisedimenticolaceae bacterium]|nr:hypothetical protein [Candidatus Polarisedimenticolaceae bacterium]
MREPIDLRNDDALDALLRESLEGAGAPAPFEVDVADAVMMRIAEAGPQHRAELVRWAIAAALAGVALLASALWHGPSLDQVVVEVSKTTAITADTAAKLSRPAETMAQQWSHALTTLLAALQTLARPLAAFRPLAQLTLTAAIAAMAAFSLWVVGRDLRFARQKEQA